MQKLLTPDGAEFLVLGNLLVRGIYAYKNYVNTPDFDVVAFNPDNNKKIARIEVKSRQYKDAKMYQLRSFKSDFVVFVQLNKYTRTKKKKIFTGNENNINYIIIPTKKVKSLKRRKTPNTWGRFRINIGDLSSYKRYENDLGWHQIKKFLKIKD